VITAVDTSVLLDVFLADPSFGPASQRALRECLASGRVVACAPVWAEVSAAFPRPEDARAALDRLEIVFEDLTPESALRAGALWRAWRAACGGRERVVPDFLIGAHALTQAQRLLTRDRGFYRRWFEGLRVLDPSA